MAKINHTAAQIDAKLNLINENKNWLHYPYDYSTLQIGLEDVGDGSFLTTSDINSEVEIDLNTAYELPEGSYIVSIDVTDITDITDTPILSTGFGLKIDGNFKSSQASYTASVSSISISLVIPEGARAGLLIKPMIRKADEADTTWVPYMKTIGSYVDERFNSTNIKLKNVLEFMKLVEIKDVQE